MLAPRSLATGRQASYSSRKVLAQFALQLEGKPPRDAPQARDMACIPLLKNDVVHR